MTTNEELTEIEERANAATEGPWHEDRFTNGLVTACGRTDADGDQLAVADGVYMQADREFISHARDDVPALIAEVRRRASALESAEARLAALTTSQEGDARDGLARAMCAIESRSKAATLEEVVEGIERWTRHRYEADRLITELADYGLTVAAFPVLSRDIAGEIEDDIERLRASEFNTADFYAGMYAAAEIVRNGR